MAERSLRGTNLSTLSLETDEGIAFSERQMVSYKCAQGHVIEGGPVRTGELAPHGVQHQQGLAGCGGARVRGGHETFTRSPAARSPSTAA
mgnify:CR=1 FL=1